MTSDRRDPLEAAWIEAVGALTTAAPGAPPAPERAESGLTGVAALDLLDAQLESRHVDLAARWLRAAGPRLLHDRLGRPREQRRGRRCPASHRPRPAALPLRRVLLRTRAPGGRHRSGHRHPARDVRFGRRADRGRQAQGLRPARAGRHPADVDDRQPPAPRGRGRVHDRPGTQVACADRLAARRAGGLQLRGRIGQPLDRGRRDQHGMPLRPQPPPAAAAVRLRGQRHRHQRPHTGRLDRGRVRRRARACDTPAPMERTRPGRTTRACELAEWVRTEAPARVPAPQDGAVPGSRGQRRRGRVPHTGRDPPGLPARPDPGNRPRCWSSRAWRRPTSVIARSEQIRTGCGTLALAMVGAPQLASTARRHGPAVAPQPGSGRRRGSAVRARQGAIRDGSAGRCPRTRAR